MAARRTVDIEGLVRDNERLVHREVWRFRRQHPRLTGCDQDDLVSFGLFGLFKAAGGYQPSRGEFSTYAVPAIQHEIIKQAERVSREFRRFKLVSLDEPSSLTEASEREVDQIASPIAHEEMVIDQLETEGLFQEALQRLYRLANPMAQWVVFAHAYYGQTFTELSKDEGVTSMAISLRYQKALKQLRSMR